MLSKIFGNLKSLESGIDITFKRNELLGENIANVDTPGYKRKDINFSEVLRDTGSNINVSATHPGHIRVKKLQGAMDSVSIGDRIKMRFDGNSVDIDKEMTELAKNQIQYNALIQKLNSEFRRLKSAISEGRG